MSLHKVRGVEPKTLAQQIGYLIRKLRKTAGFSQEGFADFCGMHRVTLGVVERGQVSPNIDTIARCTKALNITLAQFFTMLESNLEIPLELASQLAPLAPPKKSTRRPKQPKPSSRTLLQNK